MVQLNNEQAPIKRTRAIGWLGLVLLGATIRLGVPVLGTALAYSPVCAILFLLGAVSGPSLYARLGAALGAIWLSDLCLGYYYLGAWTLFYQGCYWQYLCYALTVLFGGWLKNYRSSAQIWLGGGLTALLFFGISNFGVWLGGGLYPLTLEGLALCYLAALPFLKLNLLSNLGYLTLLLGGVELVSRGWLTNKVLAAPGGR